MSENAWQAYVDQNLMCPLDAGGNTLASAALLGHDGSVWAQSPAFPALTAAEGETIAKLLSNPESNTTGSFTMGGIKYMIIQSEDPETKLRGKCAGGGCAVSKTGMSLVVGVWAEPVVASACNRVVEHLADYLVGVGY